jgi:hypothetical protein
MRAVVDWISPQRPEPTDIAEYTARVARAFDGQPTLNIIDDKDSGEQHRYQKHLPPFFNIGNDARFHGATLEAAQSISGIIIAHDYRLQDLIVAGLRASRKDHWGQAYLSLMRHYYGSPGHAAATAYIEGTCTLHDVALEFPGVEMAAEKALCIITHDPGLTDELARRTGLYCTALPLPFPAVLREEPLPMRRSGGPIEALVFGYIGFNRGLDPIFEFMRTMPQLRLNIAGRIGPPELARRVRTMMASGLPIRDHGFLAEEDLDALIRRCDLVLNLRLPTMGEVSGSQLRIFAQQGLSVVCDTGWYASLPDKTTLKVRPDRLLADLSAIVERISGDRQAFDSLRIEGHRHVCQAHSLAHYSQCFGRMLPELDAALAHGRRLLLAKHLRRLHDRAGARAAAGGERLLARAEMMVGAAPC